MKRILVIEDETPIRDNICEMLDMEGFDAVGAEDGRVGLQLAQDAIPDLVICDIMMPELDGYDVLLNLRSEPQTATIPFIFLTAKVDRSFMRYGMELGADDYLTKPVTSGELLAAITTRLKRHETVSQIAEQELAQAKQSLIRMVSHELRTPLVAIRMVTDIFMRQIGQLSSQQVRELLETLERGTQRLDRLIEQIVLIVQFETDALSHESIDRYGMPIRLSDLLIASVDLARRYTSRQVEVPIRLNQRDADVTVRCDIRVLRHALAELITNALAFSPPHSEVIVSQWQADQKAWITILDHGPGIPTEQLAQAMRDFHQLDRETYEQQGVGLGLPLARRIIDIHGGSFEIDSVVDKGTQVTINLPVKIDEG
jgi:two-component system sensor histidine kinase/response regulator